MMRRRGDILWVAALAIALLALPASAQMSIEAGATGVIPAGEGGAMDLYDQTDNASGNGAPDQNFEAAYDAYDAEGADDFDVTWPDGWVIQQVRTVGTTGGTSDSININFYADAGGAPAGTPTCTYDDIPITAGAGTGSFTVDLPTDCVLPMGLHWVAVQTNHNFAAAGQHFWSNRTVQTNAESVWRNPGDGFGSGCTTFTPQTTCGVGGGTNPDFLFVVNGVLGEPPPPPGIEIPTLDVVGLLLLIGALALGALFLMRRRQSQAS
ncbi:MAG: hypothetical protein SX243_15285 [Acidobacteriota bacterium]|nr:hypothetical protein [Acidobacteriota bacterium]